MDVGRTRRPATSGAQSTRRGRLVTVFGSPLGVGRLVDIDGSQCVVEYFDHPGDGGRRLVDVPLSAVKPAHLAPQTRVHVQQDSGWWHGRVQEHRTEEGVLYVRLDGGRERYLSEQEVEVRWRRPLADATTLLAAVSIGSRRFHYKRNDFVKAYLARLTAYQGLTALASAVIEAHPHQIEAARRVLFDPTPRYLLADEVGLGKTIEAGIIIRQHLLDRARGPVLLLVPETLVPQWRSELEARFRLATEFPGRFEVRSFAALDAAPPARAPSLLVVDEVHDIASFRSSRAADRYAVLAELARNAGKLLLLSATPLLQDPASLLRLLHLLSPETYRLEDRDSFERSLQGRADIGRLHATLTPDASSVFLELASAEARQRLAHDRHLMRILDELDAALARDDDAAIQAGARRARAHIGEAHRLLDRMIRTRRATGLAEEFPVLGREEPSVERIGTDFAAALAVDAWRETLAIRLQHTEDVEARALLLKARGVLEASCAAGPALEEVVRARLGDGADTAPDADELPLLTALLEVGERRASACPRVERSVALALSAHASDGRVVVVAGTEAAADMIHQQLTRVIPVATVARLNAANADSALNLGAADAPCVLVCGPAGEEGQNLQWATHVIHADLPWDPNRLEQRLGRFDRFGPGAPAVQSLIVDDDDQTVAAGWADLLSAGFGSFSRSLASLQLPIDDLLPSLVSTALTGGAEALRRAAAAVSDTLEEELSRVESEELLHETTADVRGVALLDQIEDAESAAATRKWAEVVTSWAAGGEADRGHADLRFHQRGTDREVKFCLTSAEAVNVSRVRVNDLPLVALDRLRDDFAGAFDDGAATGTFRRNSATSRRIRLFNPGDPFVEALWMFTEEDDRGRAFAQLRCRSSLRGRDEMLAFCVDVRITPDVGAALIQVAPESRAEAAAPLARRAESYMTPVVERVWLDVHGVEVIDTALLALLEEPVSDVAGDETIRPNQWSRIAEHVGPASWEARCALLRDAAIAITQARGDVAQRCESAAFELEADGLDAAARMRARQEAQAATRAAAEERLTAALATGLRAPRTTIDAAGVVLLTGEPLREEDER
jgi:ATP-dependent helicase HepA